MAARCFTLAVVWLTLLHAFCVSGAYVVTDLRMVQGTTLFEAVNQCEVNNEWITAGVDWAVGVANMNVLLCQKRQWINAIGDVDADKVLTRLIVLENTSECPHKMKKLHAPRTNIVVCVEYEIAAFALLGVNYISNLAVTAERNYNNEATGWQTLPVSVQYRLPPTEPSYRGAFISFERPIVPITALQVVKNVAEDAVWSTCDDLHGIGWEQAGVGFLDERNDTTKTVLCIQRSQDEFAFQKLQEIEVVETIGGCPDGFDQRHSLTSTLKICTKWIDNWRDQSPYIGDVVLHRTSASNDVMPGNFQLVSSGNLNPNDQIHVHLYARKTKTYTAPLPSPPTKKPLQASANSELPSEATGLSFKVLQLADLHYTGDPNRRCRSPPLGMDPLNCTEALMTQFVNDLLDVEKPDLVVFSGDNVETFAPERRAQAMNAVTGGVEARKIPYAMVFGNHDDENGFSRETIVQMAMAKPHSYTQRGPSQVDGVGNYELQVQTPMNGPWGKAGTVVFRMYFLDSHSYPDKTKYPNVKSTYDWVKQSQIDYYRQLSHSHGDKKVPAIMFFHIPLVEYASTASSHTNGHQNEVVCSPDVNTNLFSALVDLDEVKATFVGHDHVNEYCTKRQTIQLCYGGGAGFGQAYGDAMFARRARVIEWRINRQKKRTIRSWKRHFGSIDERQNMEILYEE